MNNLTNEEEEILQKQLQQVVFELSNGASLTSGSVDLFQLAKKVNILATLFVVAGGLIGHCLIGKLEKNLPFSLNT